MIGFESVQNFSGDSASRSGGGFFPPIAPEDQSEGPWFPVVTTAQLPEGDVMCSEQMGLEPQNPCPLDLVHDIFSPVVKRCVTDNNLLSGQVSTENLQSKCLSENIRKIRKILRLTQGAFGSAIGIGKSMVSQVEKGEKGISRSVLMLIEKVYNVNTNWLLTGEGPMYREEPKVSCDQPLIDKTAVRQTLKMILEEIVKGDFESIPLDTYTNAFVLMYEDAIEGVEPSLKRAKRQVQTLR